jgi:signal transduction histidine kinase
MSTVVAVLLVVVVGALLALFIRSRARDEKRREALRLDSLEQFASHVQSETEHTRALVARQLHDELGGLFVASKMDLDWIARRVPAGDEALKSKLAQVSTALDAGLAIKRRLVERLHPSILDHLGLYAALQWQLEELCTAASVRAIAKLPDDDPGISPESAIVLFRIEHDAIARALGTGGITLVELEARIADGNFEMSVADDASQPATASGERGRPWSWSLLHRAQGLGGTCTIEGRPGGGTRVVVRVPAGRLARPTSD